MKNLRKKRKPWVIALCVIIALIMVLPIYDVVGVLGGDRNSANSPVVDTEDYAQQLINQAETLENYLEEHGPTVAVLQNLAQIYYSMFYFVTDGEEDYLEKAANAMEKAVELEPKEPDSYMFLFDLYNDLGMGEKAEETAKTVEPLLLELIEEDYDDNLSRYYYSNLLEKYHQDFLAAKEQLEIILDTEPEESELFSQTKQTLERIDNLLTELENGELNED